MTDLESYMRKAIEEARISLGEGNSGFGAVVLMEDRLIARARDAEKTDRDPTAHAEITAISRDKKKIVLHSRNFCPTLEACKVLKLDTRSVCRHLSEKPTTDLLRQLHPKLRFTRNYEKLRPHTPYCEEMIILD